MTFGANLDRCCLSLKILSMDFRSILLWCFLGVWDERDDFSRQELQCSNQRWVSRLFISSPNWSLCLCCNGRWPRRSSSHSESLPFTFSPIFQLSFRKTSSFVVCLQRTLRCLDSEILLYRESLSPSCCDSITGQWWRTDRICFIASVSGSICHTFELGEELFVCDAQIGGLII